MATFFAPTRKQEVGDDLSGVSEMRDFRLVLLFCSSGIRDKRSQEHNKFPSPP